MGKSEKMLLFCLKGFLKLYLNAIFTGLVFFICGSQGFRKTCFKHDQANCHEPFINKYKYLSRDSQNITDADTHFWLFTNNNPDVPEWLDECGGKLQPNSNFNPEHELIVIIDAYVVGVCDASVYRETKTLIIQKGNYNVLVVEWSWGNKGEYQTSIENAKIVGHQTVIVLRNIQRQTGIGKEKITILGASLAAQIAGYIGRDFPVGRITGLDPVGLLFEENLPISERLDSSDADFVDIWHCSAGSTYIYSGIDYDAGDVDFYINGGSHQSACVGNIPFSFLKGDFLYGAVNVIPGGCSHIHCAQYYKAAVNPRACQFVGFNCDSYEDFVFGKCNSCGKNGEKCAIMGFDKPKFIKNRATSAGRYYVKTNFFFPYCDHSSYLRLQEFEEEQNFSLKHESTIMLANSWQSSKILD